jgi:hypothetical protein
LTVTLPVPVTGGSNELHNSFHAKGSEKESQEIDAAQDSEASLLKAQLCFQ